MIYNGFKLSVLFTLLLCFSLGAPVRAQNVLDDIEEEDKTETTAEQAPNLVAETIRVISPSKKIFILTNENQSYSKGDFISLLVANKLVCRALVAKTTDQKLSGIKIVKIYDLALWKQLASGKEVLVLKGDDSYYTNKEKAPGKKQDKNDKKDESKLQTDEDLFNSTSLGSEDDLSLEESGKRLIRPDNLVSVNVGLIQAKDVDGSSKRYTQLNGAWAYQLSDNIWGEAALGTNTITDYPSTGLDTRLINITVRGKYTFSAPFYSYLQPYVGYQTVLAQSPSAGQNPDNDPNIDTQKEIQMVNDLKKSSVIFGVTVLKRIVPGWFMRADLGTDIINGGLTIEF